MLLISQTLFYSNRQIHGSLSEHPIPVLLLSCLFPRQPKQVPRLPVWPLPGSSILTYRGLSRPYPQTWKGGRGCTSTNFSDYLVPLFSPFPKPYMGSYVVRVKKSKFRLHALLFFFFHVLSLLGLEGPDSDRVPVTGNEGWHLQGDEDSNNSLTTWPFLSIS